MHVKRTFSRRTHAPLLGLAALSLAAAPPAQAATLIGTPVAGSISFNAPGGTNYFDPANGFVPVGPLNKTQGTTVTIADPAVEFGFNDGANADTADFTAGQLILTDVSTGGLGAAQTFYTFTDPAFTSLSLVSSTFGAGFTSSLAGTSINISTPAVSGVITRQAIFNINAPVGASSPEPSSWALLGFTAFGALGLMWKARRRTA